MSHISIPLGPVSVRVFMGGQEIAKGTRFSNLDSAINFFGWHRLHIGAGGFILSENSRYLVEAGAQPAVSCVNFYEAGGAHIDPAVVALAAVAVGEKKSAECLRYLRHFPFGVELPYRFRNGPVPGLHRGFRGRARWLRSPRTAQELRENNFAAFDEDLRDVELWVVQRCGYPSLPTRRDEIRRNDQVKSWKHQRSHQWRAK